jgi:AI-2 transport protein TqsA
MTVDSNSAKTSQEDLSKLEVKMSNDQSKETLLNPSVSQSLASRLVAIAFGAGILIYLQSILIPLVLAILLAFLLSPVILRFTSWGIPYGLSIVSAQFVTLVVVLGALMLFSVSVGPLSRALPKYRNALVQEITDVVEWASGKITNPKTRESLKLEISESILPKAIDQGVKMTQKGLSTTTSVLGYFFLTLLLSTFILLESSHMKDKLKEAYDDEHPLLISMKDIGEDVRAYVVAKTLISLLTSFFVWLVLVIANVDFAVFWSLLAFPLNFIPTVGAIVASLPPIIIALIDPDLSSQSVLIVLIGLSVVNGFIGSVIDPRYVGQKVKLSPLVVLVSMLAWGIIWGPVGMILAVPIMVSIKVIFSHIESLQPIAILMRG